MAQETTQPISTARPGQAISGVMSPQVGEALIREAWPTVLGIAPGVASLARRLMQSLLLAPVGILLLLPVFLLKLSPFVCRRFTLTNRRLMIQRGWKPAPLQSVVLADIDAVRIADCGVDPFYVAGTLEVLSQGQVVMTLAGIPEPEGFRQAILNAVKAWVPGKASGPFLPASAAV